MSHQPTVFPTLEDAQDMLTYWARTPANGFLGTSYGGRDAVLSALQQPWSANLAECLLKALAADVPSLGRYFRQAYWSQGGTRLVLTTPAGAEASIEV
jgi:hypothetical protein